MAVTEWGICVDVVGQLMGGVEDSTIVVDRSMWNDAIKMTKIKRYYREVRQNVLLVSRCLNGGSGEGVLGHQVPAATRLKRCQA